MKNRILFLSGLLFWAGSLLGQVSTYTFVSSSGSYTEIAGGTLLGSATSDDEYFVDPAVPAGSTSITTGPGFPIGFNFTFGGVVFDRLAVNTNGFISLGQSALTPAVDIANLSYYLPITSTMAVVPPELVSRVVAVGQDLMGQTGSGLRIQTTGTAPNRECVIQWKGFRKYNATGDNFNFQIRLMETTNKIKVVYGVMTNAGTSISVQVGLRGAPAVTATNYTVRTTSINWAATTAGSSNADGCTLNNTVYPASGLTYTWSSLAPFPFAAKSINRSQIDLSFTANLYGQNVVIVWNSTGLFTTPTGTPPAVDGSLAGGTVLYNGLISPVHHSPVNAGTYYYAAYSYAGTGYSDGAFASAATSCGATILPYSEGFETYVVPATGCLNVEDVNSDGQKWVTSTYFPRTGINHLSIRYSAPGTPMNDWVFSPGLMLTGGQSYNVMFYYRSFAASTYSERLEVKWGSLATASAMTGGLIFSDIDFITSSYIPGSGFFTPPATGIYYVGWHCFSQPDQDGILIDDILIEATPACNTPGGVTSSAVGLTTATISWTAPSLPPANGYQYEVRISGAPGSGDSGLGASGSTGAGIVSAPVTGLAANTTYSVYVRSNCGPGFSPWTSAYTFSTLCGLISGFPYRESFDWMDFAPPCWSNFMTAGPTLPGTWDRQNSGTHPFCSTHSGDGMARFNCWDYHAGTTGILATPALALPTDQYAVHFWMYREDGLSGNADLVNVYYNINPNTTGATLLGTVHRCSVMTPVVAHPDQWYEYAFNMPAGSSGNAYILFEGVSQYGNSIFIDDVSVEAASACPAGSIAELETCGTHTNDGCSMTTPAFEPVALGETICGTIWRDASDSDQDWYSFTIDQATQITLTASAQFYFEISLDEAPCSAWAANYENFGNPGDTNWIVTTCYPGTYYIRFLESSSLLLACGGDNHYWFKLAGNTCIIPPISPGVSSVTTNSASLHWISEAGLWNIEWGPSGFALGTGTFITGTTLQPYPLSGLAAGTEYDFYVQTNCSEGANSTWTGPVRFTTLCNTQMLNISEGFNTGGTLIDPACWTQQYLVGTNRVTYEENSTDPVTTPYEGTRYALYSSFYWYPGDQTRLVSPPINTIGIPSIDVNFYWYNENSPVYNYGSYLNEGVEIQYSLDGGFTWFSGVFFPRQDNTLPSGAGAWNLKTVTLPPAAGNAATLYVGFKFISAQGDNCSMDKVDIHPTPVVPLTRTVQNVVILDGESSCYNAVQTITLAGDLTTFAVQPGGSATLIAGQNIVILPTTQVSSGGYLHGYIAPDGPWCTTPSLPAVVAGGMETTPETAHTFFKIYPNPTTGNFTLEQMGEIQYGSLKVDVYGMRGEKLMSGKMTGEKRHEFSLSEMPEGLYFVKVTSDNSNETYKLVKTR